MLIHRDNGFSGEYRLNYLEVTGNKKLLKNKVSAYPILFYGFKQFDKITNELLLDRKKKVGTKTHYDAFVIENLCVRACDV